MTIPPLTLKELAKLTTNNKVNLDSGIGIQSLIMEENRQNVQFLLSTEELAKDKSQYIQCRFLINE